MGAELIRAKVTPEADAFTFAQIAGHTGVTVETENLSGVTSANQMFTSCGSLETIYATSFSNTGLSGSLMFNSCNRLVGGTDGFVPSMTSSASVCKLSAGGVLTDPNYANGEGVLTASSAPDPTRELVAFGRICAIGKYVGLGFTPWDGVTGLTRRQHLTSATFATDRKRSWTMSTAMFPERNLTPNGSNG